MLFLNTALKTLWPYYNNAVGKMVLEQVGPALDPIIAQVRTSPDRVMCAWAHSQCVKQQPLAWLPPLGRYAEVGVRVRRGRYRSDGTGAGQPCAGPCFGSGLRLAWLADASV